MTPHAHSTFAVGCYRCDLAQDEVDSHITLDGIKERWIDNPGESNGTNITVSDNPYTARCDIEWLVAEVDRLTRFTDELRNELAIADSDVETLHGIAINDKETREKLQDLAGRWIDMAMHQTDLAFNLPLARAAAIGTAEALRLCALMLREELAKP